MKIDEKMHFDETRTGLKLQISIPNLPRVKGGVNREISHASHMDQDGHLKAETGQAESLSYLSLMPCHSVRRVFTGSTEAARWAGISEAAKAQIASSPIAVASAAGSQLGTW
jgi:hypothetical protein